MGGSSAAHTQYAYIVACPAEGNELTHIVCPVNVNEQISRFDWLLHSHLFVNTAQNPFKANGECSK